MEMTIKSFIVKLSLIFVQIVKSSLQKQELKILLATIEKGGQFALYM